MSSVALRDSDARAAVDKANAEMHSFDEATSSTALLASLGALSTLMADPTTGAAVRATITKQRLIEMAGDKMRNDSHNDKAWWNSDVAAAFGKLLVAHRDGTYSGPAPAAAASAGAGEGAGDGATTLASLEAGRPAAATAAGGDNASAPMMRSAAGNRVRFLRNYNILITLGLLLVVIGSFAAGRSFGPYFAANIILLLLAAAYVVVCVRTYPNCAAEIAAHELMYIAGFIALSVGTICSFVFIFLAPGRVESYCLENPNTCAGSSLSGLQAGAVVMAIIGTLVYFGVYAYSLVLSDRYVQVLRVADVVRGGGRGRTTLTPTVKFISKTLMPSRHCCRGCCSCRRRRATYRPRGRICSDEAKAKCKLAFLCLLCLTFFLAPPISCFFSTRDSGDLGRCLANVTINLIFNMLR